MISRLYKNKCAMLLLVLIFISTVMLPACSTPTAEYLNDDVGFALDYPSDWEKAPANEERSEVFVIASNEACIKVRVFNEGQRPTLFALEDWFRAVMARGFPGSEFTSFRETTLADGVTPAAEIYWKRPYDDKELMCLHFYTYVGKKIVNVESFSPSETWVQNEPIFRDVNLSLRVTDEVATTSTSAPIAFTSAIPMRDGKTLKAYISLPGEEGAYPIIFIYTSYGAIVYTDAIRMLTADDALFGPAAREVFGYVCVDVRGRGENAFESYRGRAVVGKDGADVVDWIASQPWSDGKIGMWGSSSDGINQYWVAVEHPDGLTAIAPCVARLSDNYAHYYPGGVLEEAYIRLKSDLWPGEWERMTRQPQKGRFWDSFEAGAIPAADIDIPTLLITGWWDHDADFSFEAYEAINAQGGMGEYTKLVIGPWSHYYIGKLSQGHLTYPNAAGKNNFYGRRFYDYWLRGIENGIYDEGSVYYYQMGDDVWLDSSTWPPSKVKDTKYYLREEGVLSLTEPGSESPDLYVYDPNDPSPSIGGPIAGPSEKFPDLVCGPAYQSEVIEGRDDYVIYDTAPLEHDLKVVGRPSFKVYIKCNCPDTDMAVRLCDYDPETGKTLMVMPGIKRMRYRSSWTEPSWMDEGVVYEASIELDCIAYTWKEGHQVRVIVSSSNYPLYAANPNNKDNFIWDDGEPLVADVQVYHDSSYPSCLILPVIGQ